MNVMQATGAGWAGPSIAEQSIIERLCPPQVAVAAARPDDISDELLPAEEAAVARALDTRRREFAQGRTCARRALARLGVPPVAIPVLPNRAPEWPAGIVGSITHTSELVCAVVAHAATLPSIGIDVESRSRRLRPRIAKFICTPAEQAARAVLPDEMDSLRLVFSAKESVHKCVAPISGITLGFHDVELDFDVRNETFRPRLVGASNPALPDFGRMQGRYAVTEHFVITVVYLPAEE